MWNCQKCNAEVDDGFEVCWSCGTSIDGREDPDFAGSDADSAPGAPEASAPAIATAEALVTIASPAIPEHAHVLRCHLEAAGIGVFIADEPVSGFDWLLHRGAEPIHLQVREIDADRAKAILAEIPTEERAAPERVEQAAIPPPAPRAWESENKESLDPREYVRALESKLSSLMDVYDTPDWKVNPAFHPEVTAFIQEHANNAAFLKKAQSMQQNRAKYFATMRQQSQTKAAAEAADADAAAAPEPADVPMCEEVSAEAPKPRLRFRVPRFIIRLAKWTVILLVLAVIVVYLTATTYRQIGERALAEAIAKIEKTDPDWRWDDLQAKRAQVPDKDNAALKVLAIAGMLPEKDTKRDALVKEIDGLEPNVPLDEAQCERLREMLDKYKGAVSEARSLANFSTGRYPPPSSRGDLSFPMAQSAVRRLLFLDLGLRAQTQKSASGALASARALVVTGRSIGDEPGIVPQLCRKASWRWACVGVERALAYGQGSDNELEAVQKLWQDEAAQPLLLYALRGERAWTEEACMRIENGDTFEWVANGPGSELGPFELWLLMGWVKENHALTLDLITEAVESAKLPVEAQISTINDLEISCNNIKRAEGLRQIRYAVSAMNVIAVVKAAQMFHRGEVLLRCTIAALAAERYRLANEKWPDSLDALVPKYLPTVPTDPYDGKPLRMRRLDDGLVIYSVGPDREDNQGTLDRKAHDLPKGKDIGFRLWDVEWRRQQ